MVEGREGLNGRQGLPDGRQGLPDGRQGLPDGRIRNCTQYCSQTARNPEIWMIPVFTKISIRILASG